MSRHIFCLEGDWDNDMRSKSSVIASLDFLQSNLGIKYIHKHCDTLESLQYYFTQWKDKRYKNYSVMYLAFHGHPEKIEVGSEQVDLEELSEMLKGSCSGKVIHFGCCNTLDTDKRKIQKFLAKTHAHAVCGFKTDIDFLESTVFDMLLLEKMQKLKDIKLVEGHLRREHGRLIKKLNFRLVY